MPKKKLRVLKFESVPIVVGAAALELSAKVTSSAAIKG
jgi:hypothetical protein